jgi:TPR repeat protein
LLEQEGKIDEAMKLYLSVPDGSAMAATAQYRLGQIYLRGNGVPQNTAQGVEWTLRSALKGHTEAQMEMGNLYFKGIGVPKNEEQAVQWFNAAAETANLSTTKAVVFTALAECYCVAGHSEPAMATMKEVCGSYPHDMDALETLAAWQLWYGKTADYETTRKRIVQFVTESDSPSVVQAAAKVWCLGPSSNADLLAKALKLARQGVELRGDSAGGAWFYLSVGMVEYRSGQYDAAGKDLAKAEQSAGKIQNLLPTVRLFQAMCLFQRNQKAEAGQLFGEVQSQMTPLPDDPKNPVINGKVAGHDVVIGWLAYREAKSLLGEPKPMVQGSN